ncbi:CLUMA_CG005306, isoform A, partial [Clunio marinus]
KPVFSPKNSSFSFQISSNTFECPKETKLIFNMKAFIIFALFAVAYADFKIATGDDLNRYRDLCKTELTIPDEDIEKFKKWDFTSERSPCYINCVFRHMHLYDNETGFQIDNLVKQLGQGRTDNIRPDIEKCIDNTVTDNCQRAFKGFQCFGKNNLQMIKSSVN